MEAVKHFLGQPVVVQGTALPLWCWLVAGLYVIFEWWLGRTDKVKSGSVLSVIGNSAAWLVARIPGVTSAVALFKKNYPKAPPPIPPTALIPFLVASLLASSCGYCLVAAHKNEARCKAQDVGVNCAAPAVVKIVSQIVADVAAALASGQFDALLSNIVATLEHEGVGNAWAFIHCAIDQVLSGHAATLSPEKYRVMKAHGDAAKKAHPVLR